MHAHVFHSGVSVRTASLWTAKCILQMTQRKGEQPTNAVNAGSQRCVPLPILLTVTERTHLRSWFFTCFPQHGSRCPTLQDKTATRKSNAWTWSSRGQTTTRKHIPAVQAARVWNSARVCLRWCELTISDVGVPVGYGVQYPPGVAYNSSYGYGYGFEQGQETTLLGSYPSQAEPEPLYATQSQTNLLYSETPNYPESSQNYTQAEPSLLTSYQPQVMLQGLDRDLNYGLPQGEPLLSNYNISSNSH